MDNGTDNIQLLSDHSRDNSLNDKGHDKLFIDEQHRDPEISCLFGKAVCENEVSQVPVCYFTKNGILMRKWHHQMSLPTLNGRLFTKL